MSILNKIRKKPKDEDREKKDKVADKSKANKQETEKKKVKAVSKAKKVIKEKIPIHHFEVIRKPHISEKAFNLESEGKYVFVVSPSANKIEIRKAVQNLYGVSVVSVNIVKVPSKPKRFKGIQGIKNGYKKAVVTLAKGSKIDVMKETK